MQKLVNKYGVEIRVVDDESLQSAFKEIVKKTHPDRNVNNGEESKNLIADFIKVTELVKEQDGNNKIAFKICAPIMEKLMVANIILRVTDVAIDTVRGLTERTEESVMKASIGYVQLAAMSQGHGSIIMPLITSKDIVYQLYQGEYQEAANTAAVGIGLPLVATTIYTQALVIETVMVIGFTFYGVYRVLDNMYDLCFSNADTVEIEKNELLLQTP